MLEWVLCKNVGIPSAQHDTNMHCIALQNQSIAPFVGSLLTLLEKNIVDLKVPEHDECDQHRTRIHQEVMCVLRTFK